MNRRSSTRGSVLIFVMLLVAILGLGTAEAWRHLHMTLKESTRIEYALNAQHLAEAGLDKALAALRAHADYRGEADTALGMGRFSVTVTPAADAPRSYVLLATGKAGEAEHPIATRTLRAMLVLDAKGGIRQYRWQPEKRS
jgi:Tfp pilus assembly protein PilX